MERTDEIQDDIRPVRRKLVPPLWMLWLGLVLLVSGGFYLVIWRPWQHRTEVVTRLESLGFSVKYNEVGPNWLRRLTGRHAEGFSMNPKVGGILDEVVSVRACPTGRPRVFPHKISENVIRDLKWFPSLERLDLTYTNVTDDWLPAISQLKSIRRLEVGHARISGRGFRQLEKLPQLQELDLAYCPMRDEYLAYLVPIRSLKMLNLYRCSHLTTPAILEFQKLRPDCSIHVDRRIHPKTSSKVKAQP